MTRWLDSVIAAFNYPEEMGERAEDALVELEELRPKAPDDHHRALLDTLVRETERGLEGKSPYSVARKTRAKPPDLELLQGNTEVWVPRADLERHRAHEKPAPPSAKAQWEAFAAEDKPSKQRTIDRRFEARTKGRLMALVGELVDEGEVALAESIARRALTEGCQFPEHFWNLLTRCLLLGDDLAVVEEPLARALLHASENEPTPLVLFFAFHEKRGDLDACRAIVDGGGAFCYRLKDRVRRPAGEKVPRAKERFAELYRDAIARVWTHARDFHQNELYEVRYTFERIGKKVLKRHLDEIAAILPPPGKLR